MSKIIRPGTSERVPFDMLIGDWLGVGIVFLLDGSYYSHITSRVTVREFEQDGEKYIHYFNDSGGEDRVSVPHEELPVPPGDDDVVDERFHPLFDDVADALCKCSYDILFVREGKHVRAVQHSSSIISANGYMSTNDNYTFIVRDKLIVDGVENILTLHNNHYFSASNTRHVIGDITDSDGHAILLTSFTYTSYTPPPARPTPRPPTARRRAK